MMLMTCNKILALSRFPPNGCWIHQKYVGTLSLKFENNIGSAKTNARKQQNELFPGHYKQSHDIIRSFKSSVLCQSNKEIGGFHKSTSAPWCLGISGLIPFITPPLLMYTQNVTCPELIEYQLYYGAVILSFLGGVRWGMAVTPGSPIPGNWSQYSWSVVPSLIAWGGLMLPDTYPGIASVIFGIGMTCYNDLRQTGYPSWFKGLRILLTTVAILSMSSSLYIMYNSQTKKPLPEVIQISRTQLEELIKDLKAHAEEVKMPYIEKKEVTTEKSEHSDEHESKDEPLNKNSSEASDSSK